MRNGLAWMVIATLCLTPAALGYAEDAPPTAAPAASPAAKHAPEGSARATEAEARYRAWVDREHAHDAAAFASEKTKIEDKYKGYVRPPHEKAGNKPKAKPEKSGE